MTVVAPASLLLAQSQAPPAPAAGGAQLVLAAVLGIAAVVLLISWLQVHPFLALIAGSAVVGLVGGLGAAKRSRASPPARDPRSAASACSSPSAR